MDDKLRILVVDDHHSILLTYTLILQEEGHDVVGAATCEQALSHLRERQFDLLLCDLGLDNGRSGWEVIDFARQQHERTVAFLLTGNSGPEVDAAARKRSVPVLYKPLEVDDLLRTVSAAASKQTQA